MSKPKTNVTRRDFVKTGAAAGAVIGFPTIVPSFAQSSPNERINVGYVGTGSRAGSHLGAYAAGKETQGVAVCDVDANHMARGKKTVEDRLKRAGRAASCATYARYEELIARKDIDAVVCTTPDHWHTKIVVEAMKQGKDIYCEKPMTLTIDEGKIICKTVKETGRVFQVGTQQRSGRQFLSAVALCRNGHMGKIKTATCSIGGGPKGGPFKKSDPPAQLDWDRWLGQAPMVDYIDKRCHYQFRWWYEYSGGKMTDWGAHHVDIAQWGIGKETTGPHTVIPESQVHPVPFKGGHPTIDDCYNTATNFQVRCKFEGDVDIIIRNGPGNGIWFNNGDEEIFVNRGGPKDKLKKDMGKVAGDLNKLYGSNNINHHANWIECIRSRKNPISDVFSHHRHLSTCHLANIAIRLNRTLKWDPVKEEVIGDSEANSWIRREQRKGYEIKA